MKIKSLLLCTFVLAAIGTLVQATHSEAENNIRPWLSPDEVENQINMDQEANPLYKSKIFAPIKDWRNGVAEKIGLNWSLDYSAFFVGVSESPGEDKASSGMARFFGYWDLVDRGTPNKGSLNWKVENRHAYTDLPPSGLGFESGYVGLFEAPFSDQQTRLTNLYWKQYFAEGSWAFVGGFLDATDFVDVYLLASPWTGFTNFMFSTGSAAMDLPNDAALGGALGGMVGKKMYVQAGVVDANSDPTQPFNDIWQGSNFFKWVEVGFTPGQERLYFDKLHLSFWHVDERGNGTPNGWGLNFSWHKWIDDKWFPFIRGGYTEDSGSLLERSMSVGLGYQPVPMRGVIGVGLNLGKPNETSFGDVGDQYTSELFWRYHLTTELAVSPSIQYVNNPALNEDEDSLWVFGVRLRLVL